MTSDSAAELKTKKRRRKNKDGVSRGGTRKIVNRILLTFIAIIVLTAAFVLPRVYENRFEQSDPEVGVNAPALTADQEGVFIEHTTTGAHAGLALPGRDGFYFLGDAHNANISQAVGRRAYSDPEIGQFSGALRAQQAYLAAKNIPLAFVVSPAKWSIYDEKLPEWTDGMPKTHIIDQLLTADPELPLVDVRQELIDAKQTADTYSPFNSHWTDYGAAVAWAPIAEWLESHAQSIGAVPVPVIEDVEVLADHDNEFDRMYGIKGANPWTVPVFETELPGYQITTPDGVTNQQEPGTGVEIGNLPATTSSPDAPNDARVLLMVDSTAGGLSPILASTFKETMMVRHYLDIPAMQPSVVQLVEDFQPDLVMYLVTERHLNLPLNDGAVWDAGNRFQASSTILSSWPAGNPTACVGTANLSSALECRVDAGRAVAIKVTATSDAGGDVNLQSGEHNVRLHLGVGSTTTYAVVPSQIGKNDLVMTAITEGLSANITGVEIRAVT